MKLKTLAIMLAGGEALSLFTGRFLDMVIIGGASVIGYTVGAKDRTP